MKELPKYAKVGNTMMILHTERNSSTWLKPPFYYRDNGCWGVEVVKNNKNQWTTLDETMPHLNNLPIVEVTKEEWEKDNK